MKSLRNWAVDKSIEHWERMIATVISREPKGKPDKAWMEQRISETWYSRDCMLCQVYGRDKECKHCPLKLKYYRCGDKKSADYKIILSCTWEEWLKHSNTLLRQLNSLRRKPK